MKNQQENTQFYCVDIETSGENALDFNRNIIDLVGITNGEGEVIYQQATNSAPLDVFVNKELLGHNLKFDLKTLIAKGYKIDIDKNYAHDTLMMAVASVKKIEKRWLEQYELKRQELNKALPKGKGHRKAGPNSLKTLAPYHLGVSPFWENTETHNDPEYLRKDLQHTLALFHFFMDELKKQGTYSFYIEKLMPWQKMIMEAEISGIRIDLNELTRLEAMANQGAIDSLKSLREQWKHVEEEWYFKSAEALKVKYREMEEKAKSKLKPEDKKYEEKVKKVGDRYQKLLTEATAKIEPFNYASPAQMMWALKDKLGYNVTDMEGEESTGAQVLEVLAKEGKEDIKALLKYRENYKLSHSYFPNYRTSMFNGKIHSNFNLGVTKTGRTSSSGKDAGQEVKSSKGGGVNLQQVPSNLKSLFIADEGKVLVSLDLSAIEPVLIAYYTEDEKLCNIMINGLDFHGFAAKALFDLKNIALEDIKTKLPEVRYAAKQADLSLFYGSGANRLFTTLTLNGMIKELSECRDMVKRYREMFKDVFFFKEMLDAELESGNSVDNIVGRKVKIEDPEDVYMQGFNRLIQSSGSDILLQGVLDFLTEMKATGYNVQLKLLVHDNAVVECKESEAEYITARLNHHLTKFKLPTKHGNIPMKAEGGYAKAWIK